MFLYQVQARNVERVTEDVLKEMLTNPECHKKKKRQVLNITVTHFNTSSLQLKLIASSRSQQPSVCLMGTPLHF